MKGFGGAAMQGTCRNAITATVRARGNVELARADIVQRSGRIGSFLGIR